MMAAHTTSQTKKKPRTGWGRRRYTVRLHANEISPFKPTVFWLDVPMKKGPLSLAGMMTMM
jgi:hypothetical protein